MITRNLFSPRLAGRSADRGCARANAIDTDGRASHAASSRHHSVLSRGARGRGLDRHQKPRVGHQAIAGMGMPEMTRPFRLDDAVAISTIKAGDTIAFVLTATAQGTRDHFVTGVESSAGAGNKAAQAMPGVPEMHSRSGLSMMEHCEEMMKRN